MKDCRSLGQNWFLFGCLQFLIFCDRVLMCNQDFPFKVAIFLHQLSECWDERLVRPCSDVFGLNHVLAFALQAIFHFSHTSIPFVLLLILQIKFHNFFPGQSSLDSVLPTYASHIFGIIGTCQHFWFICCDGSLTFCLD
jgi:hypothetical protein